MTCTVGTRDVASALYVPTDATFEAPMVVYNCYVVNKMEYFKISLKSVLGSTPVENEPSGADTVFSVF